MSAHCDLRDQAQMAGDKLVRGFGIAVVGKTVRQHVFFFRFQERELFDRRHIGG